MNSVTVSLNRIFKRLLQRTIYHIPYISCDGGSARPADLGILHFREGNLLVCSCIPFLLLYALYC